MYAALGFLAATLLALLVLPAVWRRAVRLTTRRIENALPVSMAEFLADKDQQRAAFAVALRREELRVEEQRARNAQDQIELARRTERVAELEAALAAATAESEDRRLAREEAIGRLQLVEAELALRSRELQELHYALEAARRELGDATARADALRTEAEHQRVEAVALGTRADNLKDRTLDLERQLAAVQARLADERSALKQMAEQVGKERERSQTAASRLADAEMALAAAREEVAELARRLGDNQKADTADLRAERDRLREQLALREAEIAAYAAAGPAPAAPVPDAAALRERILTLAAEVAHITATLEGPESPIHALVNGHVAGVEGEPPTLADRIRRLQKDAAPAGEPLPAAVDA